MKIVIILNILSCKDIYTNNINPNDLNIQQNNSITYFTNTNK